MTAQIGVINKKCVALATDSAVTIGSGQTIKAFNTAEKLFTLSKGSPVGIMIYNNAEFLGIPWEILVKEYRKNSYGRNFDTLHKYAQDFFSFINEYSQFNILEIRHNIMRIALYHLENILDKTNSILQQITDINPLILKQIILNCTEEYNQIISQNIGEFYTNNVENISYYSRDIEAVVTNNINIDKIPMDADDINKIVSCVSSAIISECYSQIKTGIVIAGYGEKEIFPSIYEYLIELKLGDSLKYTLVNKSEIGISVDEEKSDSAIMTFAQSEMAHTFVTGINPELEHKLKEEIINIVGPITERYEEVRNHLNLPVGELNEEQTNILKTLGDSIIHSIITELEEIQKEKHIHPFVQMVATLDKQQMAELAETLVSLTSFKRKMSMDTETVGGPIDVAIISKGEGFIWIKRKEYFDSKLNNHYFTKDCQYTRRDFND